MNPSNREMNHDCVIGMDVLSEFTDIKEALRKLANMIGSPVNDTEANTSQVNTSTHSNSTGATHNSSKINSKTYHPNAHRNKWTTKKNVSFNVGQVQLAGF